MPWICLIHVFVAYGHVQCVVYSKLIVIGQYCALCFGGSFVHKCVVYNICKWWYQDCALYVQTFTDLLSRVVMGSWLCVYRL